MHIVFFHQYYHTPDCPTSARPYALVERLSRNHEVTVITTRTWKEKRLAHQWPWAPNDARLIQLDIPYRNEMSSLDRLRSFLQYAVQALLTGLQSPPPDLIIGASPPLTVPFVAAAISLRHDVPWLFEARDLWPDFPLQMQGGSWPGLSHSLRGLEALLYRSAAHVVTLSPDMEQHVRTTAPTAPVTCLPYGSDLQLVDNISEATKATLRRRFALDRRFLILYAGALGRANAIPTLLDAATQLADRDDVLIGIAGRGYYEDAVRRTAGQHEHIRFLDPLPYPKALALFSMADVSLVSFIDRPVLTTNAPNKFYDSLAAGTSVVVTNPGWTKRFVERHDCGWYVPPESPTALANQLRTLLDAPEQLAGAGQRGRTAARQHFDRAALMNEYAHLVNAIGRVEGCGEERA